MKELKIRASQLGRLMATDSKTSITEKQLATLNSLLAKIKLTDKQADLRDALLLKRDAEPELSKGAKSFITELYLEREFGIKQEINSKYLDKGKEVEDASIELTRILLEKDFLFKNEDNFYNDFVQGTPDVITEDNIIDVKSSWSAATFPFFDTELNNNMYEWQLKAYMWITGKTKSYLCYCLVPTPENLILDEMRRVSWKRGEGAEVSEETEQEVIEYFDISKIPTEKRLKAFKVILTDEDINKMKTAVKMAREYYKTLS
jgi:hypothetical protein